MVTFSHIPFPKKAIYKCQRSSFGGKRWYDLLSDDDSIIHRFPSITTVLSTEEKPYLAEWRQKIGIKKAAAETIRCQERGENVHLLIEDYLKNDPDFKKDHVNQNIKIFNQMKSAVNKINNIMAQEVYLYNTQLKVAGTVDCIAEYNGKLSVIDFKVANSIRTADQIEDYFIQSTAYALMCYEMYEIPIENIVIIMGVERGAILPLVFERNIENYIKPLIKKIDCFFEKNPIPQAPQK